MTVYRTINMPPVVMLALLRAKDHFDRLRSGARLSISQKRISQVRAIELLLGYVEAHPPSTEFICNFIFRSPPPGRPAGKKLGSKSKPPVSEDQPRDNKTEDRPIYPRPPGDSTGSHHSW